MDLKLKKTDHEEQSLVLYPRVFCLIREGMEAIMSDPRLSVILRDNALELKQFLEDSTNEDKPALFTKQKSICLCKKCGGSRVYKVVPDDRSDEVEWLPCEVCGGEGQLYMEIVRRGIPATEYHRKKMID